MPKLDGASSITIKDSVTNLPKTTIKPNDKSQMAASMKLVHLFGGVLVIITRLSEVNGAGECCKANPDMEAFKLTPCVSTAQDVNASVSGRCCTQVKKLGQNPKCLCAVMLSNTAKSSGIKPEIAMTIPKRCNIVDRPVGYHCGAYTLP